MRAFAITPSDFANVRNCPGMSGKIVGRVDNGQIVTVSTEVQDGWTRLEQPAGWVFEGVTFRRVPDIKPGDIVSDGFDAPVGLATERAGAVLWPGWTNSNPFLNFTDSYHTGVDLNLNLPGQWDADAGKPLYAVASGLVTSAATFKTWGWLIIIRHDPLPDGLVVWSRYAHMATVDVIDGQRVARGEPIGTIGNANGRWSHHLHYDIAKTDILETAPDHWPGTRKALVLQHYVDPKAFIEAHRPR